MPAVRRKPSDIPGTELKLLSDLVDEQLEGTRRRAEAGKEGMAVCYMGMGDHLVLLVVQKVKPQVKKYLCRVIDVEEGE